MPEVEFLRPLLSLFQACLLQRHPLELGTLPIQILCTDLQVRSKMRPFIQASAPYISLLCLLLSLLFLIFSINHSVAHNVSSVQRNIPHTTYTSDALTLRIESSRIAVPFGDRHASYEIGLLSNTTHNEKRLAKRESVWYEEALLFL